VLDAQGNTISVYDRKIDSTAQTITYEQSEKYIYGSSRLGVLNTKVPLLGSQNDTYSQERWTNTIGEKTYEISNHLGNVLSVISDKPIPDNLSNGGTVAYYLADIRQSSDYSPFGVTLKGRDFGLVGAEDNRYGFNSMEKDDELKGTGNSYDFGARMYDPRLGRWLAVDPLVAKYPALSPYSYCANNPILFIDPDGKDIAIKDPATGKLSIFKPGDKVPDGASKFVSDAYESLNYLNSNAGKSAVNIIDNLVSDKGYIVTITEEKGFGSGKTAYAADQSIKYNPYEGLIVGQSNDGNDKQSPSLGLLHELDHANQHRTLNNILSEAKAKLKEANTKENKAAVKVAKAAITEFWLDEKDVEENRVTQGSEQDAAKSLKQGFRKIYDDVKGIFKTDGPNSTKNWCSR